MSSDYKLYCCGSRGIRPVEGRRFNEFGGLTTCYILKKDDRALIFDCGTGLYEAKEILMDCRNIDVFFSHVNYDCILGLLDESVFSKKTVVTFHYDFESEEGERLLRFLKGFFNNSDASNFRTVSTRSGEKTVLGKDIVIYISEKSDSANTQILTICAEDEEGNDHTIALIFETQIDSVIDMDAIRDCDYLIYDGMYTDKDYEPGKGHSTWQQACRLAARVNCGRLIVTQHHPDRTDDELRRYERFAKEIYPDTDFARSGQEWIFPLANAGEVKEVSKEVKNTSRVGSFVNAAKTRFNEIVLNTANRSRLLGIGSYLILGIVAAFMTIVNIATGKNLLMMSTLIFAILCFVDVFLDTQLKVDYRAVQTIFQIECLCLFTFFVVSGTPEGFSIIWILLLPVGGMFVFGKKRTTVLCLIMMFILCYLFYYPMGRSLLQYRYTESFMLRFPMAFFAFFILAYFIEAVRERTYREIENLKNSQASIIADQTAELREQNKNMMRINAELKMKTEQLKVEEENE